MKQITFFLIFDIIEEFPNGKFLLKMPIINLLSKKWTWVQRSNFLYFLNYNEDCQLF
jgi:hypothetical protein